MKIKRYFGNTTQEAMAKLKKELGSDAVILHTRKIKREGILGFLKKPLVEIVAAIEEPEKTTAKPKTSISKEPLMPKVEMKDIFQMKNEMHNSMVNDEVKRLRETVEHLVYNIESNGDVKLPDELKPMHKILVDNGVEAVVATKLMQELIQEQRKLDYNYDSREMMTKILSKYLGKVSPISLDGKQKIVFFIGPTGVGKTTTLAKIAAQYALVNKNKIGLITADTYRVAAVEQLKTYSEILNIPLKIIYEGHEIVDAIKDYYDKELILVDTAGRNHNSKDKIIELTEMLAHVSNPEIFLVLSSTTNYNAIVKIIEKYSEINDFKLIFTKLDESENIGVVLSTKYNFDNELSYVTTGQSVPEDIQLVNIEEVVKTLLKEQHYA